MRSVFALALLLPGVLALSPPIVQTRQSPVVLPISVRYNATRLANIVEVDKARARLFVQTALEKIEKILAGLLPEGAAIGVPVTNTAVSYIASVGVGSPATQFNLIVDTGSSNTWVGAGTQIYTQTATSSQTGDSVSVSYGSGSFSGNEFIDQVTLASGLVIKKQSIGVATSSAGFSGVDGILGVGPTDLTIGTLSPDTSATIPTVTDNLFSQGTISYDLIGVSFATPTSTSDTNGEITFGGTDSSKYAGSITYVPITPTSPASNYWGIDQSIAYGSSTILPTTAGIVDTGTTLILIASDAFAKYQQSTGATQDSTTGLLTVTQSQFANLQSLFFNVGGTSFELTPSAQTWPPALNTAIGGDPNSIYLIVADLGSNSGQGLDFISGQTFLEHFYSVYDTGNQRVGLAPAV